ncbi:GDP-mannose-dependent alpha-(1-6)-phosphatidylinositol monomannoside mannosyltransferase [bacterium BMS3Bbin01]|nr:GDP-mannose-dependent alpha-(1-6)-phosphatidylinositol monomannoside mannosyltransferase [bacterium BMS3Bbin01]
MRVLVITNDFPPAPGGIQRYVGDLLRHAPWVVHVAAPFHSGASSDVRVSRYDRALTPTRRAATWIAGLAREHRCDVVLYAALPLALLGPGVAERTGVPYALFLHGAELTVPAAVPGVRRRYARALGGAAARFAVSRYTKRRAEERFDMPVCWVGAGVDIDVFSPGPVAHEGFVVGCVGRFVRRKGHADVLRAVSSLRAEGLPARSMMIGWGPSEQRLRRIARRCEVPTEFRVGISQTTLADAYHEMDVFAMPARSRWAGLEVEGLGLVYLEAAASGLPVIAGSSGGAPETVDDGRTGFVVANRPELVSALRALQTDPDLAAGMGSAGRARVVELFTWPAVAARIDAQLREAGDE